MRIIFLILNLVYWAEAVWDQKFKVGKFQFFNGSASPAFENRCQAVFLSKRVAITLRECGHTLATNGRPRDYRIEKGGTTLKMKKSLMANALNGASPMVLLLAKDCSTCIPSSDQAYFTWSNYKVEETITARHYPEGSDIVQGLMNIVHDGTNKKENGLFTSRTKTDKQTMMNEDKFGRIVLKGTLNNFEDQTPIQVGMDPSTEPPSPILKSFKDNSTLAKGAGIVIKRTADPPVPERYELFGLFYDRCQPHLYSGDTGIDVSYCGIRFRHQSWLKICTGIENKWKLKTYADGLPRGCKEHWLRHVSKDHYGTNLLSSDGAKQVEDAIKNDAAFVGCVLRCYTDCPMAPAMPATFDALHYRLDHFRKYHFFRYVDDAQSADNWPILTCKNAAGTKSIFSELEEAAALPEFAGTCNAPTATPSAPMKNINDLMTHGSKTIGAPPTPAGGTSPNTVIERFLFDTALCPAKPVITTTTARRRRRSAKEMRFEAFRKHGDQYSYLNNHKEMIKRHKQLYQNKLTNDARPDV